MDDTYTEFSVRVDGRHLKTYNEIKTARDIAQQWQAAGNVVQIIGARFSPVTDPCHVQRGNWIEGEIPLTENGG